MNRYLLTFCVLFFTLSTQAQKFADTTTIGMSPLKTMTYEQYKAYVDGDDHSDMATVAKVNHYPDPEKVLLLKKELTLNADQTSKIITINVELKRKMREMGAFIIKNETTLDNLFQSKKIDDGSLIFYGQRTDLYKGELRNAVLQAYVKVRAILSAGQIKKYNDLQNSQGKCIKI